MNGNLKTNFNKFKQKIEIYLSATETCNKTKQVQEARSLNLMGSEALNIYNTMEIAEITDAAVEEILRSIFQFF